MSTEALTRLRGAGASQEALPARERAPTSREALLPRLEARLALPLGLLAWADKMPTPLLWPSLVSPAPLAGPVGKLTGGLPAQYSSLTAANCTPLS